MDKVTDPISDVRAVAEECVAWDTWSHNPSLAQPKSLNWGGMSARLTAAADALEADAMRCTHCGELPHLSVDWCDEEKQHARPIIIEKQKRIENLEAENQSLKARVAELEGAREVFVNDHIASTARAPLVERVEDLAESIRRESWNQVEGEFRDARSRLIESWGVCLKSYAAEIAILVAENQSLKARVAEPEGQLHKANDPTCRFGHRWSYSTPTRCLDCGVLLMPKEQP